jgi:hypothetical protein
MLSIRVLEEKKEQPRPTDNTMHLLAVKQQSPTQDPNSKFPKTKPHRLDEGATTLCSLRQGFPFHRIVGRPMTSHLDQCVKLMHHDVYAAG